MDSQATHTLSEQCVQALMLEWFEFEKALAKVPIVKRLESGRLSLESYQQLLVNLRQQVIEGSRWISRTASSFERDFADIRATIINHAHEEQADYRLLEQDYVATGGNLNQIQQAQPNVGTDAFHAFMMHKASEPNPIHMLGAMWMIEGLGQKMANKWAQSIDESLGGNGNYSTFMRYHADNDEAHMQKFFNLLEQVCQSDADVLNITKTARVVGRLYVLQLEEIDRG